MESDKRNQQTNNDFKDAKLTNHRKPVSPMNRNTRALCGISRKRKNFFYRVVKGAGVLVPSKNSIPGIIASLAQRIAQGQHLSLEDGAGLACSQMQSQGNAV
ncbi:MAG: hypothetical protein ABI040_04640 [Rhodoferax sp.]